MTDAAMAHGILNDFWRDVLGLVSTAVTLVGLPLGLLSLIYAVRQIQKTQTAAEAARAAADEVLAENRRLFQRYAVANSVRILSELKTHIEKQDWEKAGMRLGDLAGQVAQLAPADPDWEELRVELRSWEASMRRLAQKPGSRFASRKWTAFHTRFQSKIDRAHGPFMEMG